VARWPATKAAKVLAALKRIGWTLKRQGGGSHRVFERAGWADLVWSHHDGAELGPKMLARIAKVTGLEPSDL
jgi:predicted RNA binding protein YcfA (HicA-like mRNA interferase family)